jgi:hypothetical protein
MAGFAVFMTILIFGSISLAVAAILSICLYFFAKKRTLRERRKHNKLINVSTLAPFLALAWLTIAFLIHVEISSRLAHQDSGFSPDPYVTLPNGYVLGSANYQDGYIVAPGYSTGVAVAGPGYVRSIVNLEWKGDNFTGTQYDFETSSVRRFVFDTRTQAFDAYPMGPLTWDASRKDEKVKISYWKLYQQYRHHWPTYVLVFLIVAGESAIVFWVWKLWHPSVSFAPSIVRN